MTTSPDTRTPRWVKILLVLSLAANLLIVGAAAGFMLRGGPIRSGGFGIPVEGLRDMQRSLSEADRAALRREFRARGPMLRAARRDMVEIRDDFVDLLRAEDFSPDRLAVLFDRQRGVLQNLAVEARDVMTARIAAMSPEVF